MSDFLFFAVSVPGVDSSREADDVADELVAILNKGRKRDARVMVSAIPGPQWLTPETLANLRRAARGES